MSATRFFSLLLFPIFVYFGSIDCLPQQITLYTDSYQEGSHLVVPVGDCFNLPGWMNDKASSVSALVCAKLYQDANCRGRSFKVGTIYGIEPHNFADYSFNDVVSSVSRC